MAKVDAVSYSWPLDPQMHDVATLRNLELQIARMTQYHQCSFGNCLKTVKRRTVCKRRAPFPLAEDDWVDEEGLWGPKRLCELLNGWNPAVLRTIRANHDTKIIMSGGDMKVHYQLCRQETESLVQHIGPSCKTGGVSHSGRKASKLEGPYGH